MMLLTRETCSSHEPSGSFFDFGVSFAASPAGLRPRFFALASSAGDSATRLLVFGPFFLDFGSGAPPMA